MKKDDLKYMLVMKHITRKLKSVDNKFNRADIDLATNGKCSFGAFLWQERLIVEMGIYIYYLGYLDGLLTTEKQAIEWDTKFNNEEERRRHEQKYKDYINKRNDWVAKIDNETRLMRDLDFLADVLNHIPSYEKFNHLYDDMYQNPYQLELQLQFMNYYNTGFMKRSYVDYQYITKQLDICLKDIYANRENNKLKLKKIENKKRK